MVGLLMRATPSLARLVPESQAQAAGQRITVPTVRSAGILHSVRLSQPTVVVEAPAADRRHRLAAVVVGAVVVLELEHRLPQALELQAVQRW